MKSQIKANKESRMTGSPHSLTIKSVLLGALILAGILAPLQAQDIQYTQDNQAIQYTQPSFWFGAAGGANLNFYRGSTQILNADFTPPTAFHDGSGVGLYLAPLIEFHRPDTRLGLMLQAGYDSRRGSFDQVVTPCNCPADLSTNLSYITVEPSLRIAPFKSDFYIYAGPRFAFNLTKAFKYEQGINPDYPLQVANPDVKGDFSKENSLLLSMQVGAGYDIHLSSKGKRTQTVLSPFVSFQPYFGQNPRLIETWNVTTVRVGAALKFGRGHSIPRVEEVIILAPVAVVVVDPEVQFSVNSPRNIPVSRRVRETFPIRNYVYFTKGSTKIPDRYILIKKNEVKNFKEDQMEVLAPKTLSGRSSREMLVYYNILNILGDRMGKNPSSTITLVGSSETGAADGRAMAESVKAYLVGVFSIDASRIAIEGRIKPKVPSERPGGERDLELLREGDQRVTIESGSPALLMEFQSGPDSPLSPVEIVAIQEAPMDSYVAFKAEGAAKAFSTWSLEIRDEMGAAQYFGPYTQEQVFIPGKSILGDRSEGEYKVTMVGQTKSGKTVKKETSTHIALWKPSTPEEGMRFSIIFDFNDSKALTVYDKYLTEVVAPKIPSGATVIIHGHTDITGEVPYNQVLSLARANEVKGILEKGLLKAGARDVIFEIYGFGEDESLAPFENKLPEGRAYNRTVIIDIIPPK